MFEKLLDRWRADRGYVLICTIVGVGIFYILSLMAVIFFLVLII
jgi:hypothetical protein